MKSDSTTAGYPAEMSYDGESSDNLDGIVNLFANHFEKSNTADSTIQ